MNNMLKKLELQIDLIYTLCNNACTVLKLVHFWCTNGAQQDVFQSRWAFLVLTTKTSSKCLFIRV